MTAHQQEARWLIAPRRYLSREDSVSFPTSQRSLCDGLGFSNSKIHLRYRILTFNPLAIPFGFKQLVYLLLASTKTPMPKWEPDFSRQRTSCGFHLSPSRHSRKFLLEWFVRRMASAAAWGLVSAHRPCPCSPLHYKQPVLHLGYSAVVKSYMKKKKRKDDIV